LRPLPKHLDERAVEKMINPNKDVDGISPVNMAKLFAGDNSGFAPCTAQAVVEMLDFIDLPLAGKRVTIVGRSLVVGKPLALLLMKKDCTVTVCHTKTVDIPKTCQNAEIVVAAAGRAKMIDERFIAKGSIVIDVGINVDEDGRLCGDVDLASISNAAIATPVPGGVGTVTTSVLASHVIKAAKIRRK
ncbi:MAG: bifunctional 5,10-methylenetetrahydrofolate dehydrogenase/5,10-methenyltetrahydrofolate cyclohydrolase, partial [Lachnospiraceae bacterium]